MHDDHQFSPESLAYENESRFVVRMFGVAHRQRERVPKGGRCFLEANAVLAKIAGGLFGTPREL
jgi:hypothetical protein